jgi:hypothetical protein
LVAPRCGGRQPRDPALVLVEQMVAIWNEEVAGTPLRRFRDAVNGELAAALATLFASEFGSDLGHWRNYCAWAAQDPQCRGERNSAQYAAWSATLPHVVRSHVYARLSKTWQEKKTAERRAARPAPDEA